MAAVERKADWDPRGPEVAADQLRYYDRMLSECPVAHSDYLGWSVFKHADVVAIAENHKTFSSAVSEAHPAVPNGYDPPKHTQYRQINNRYFTPERIAKFESGFRRLARDMVLWLPREVEFEFIADFATRYALRTQQIWLGWPRQASEALEVWTERNQKATRIGDRAELDDVAAHFDAAVRSVITLRRETPIVGDITTDLLQERVDGIALSEAEIVSILRNWTVGELGTMAASVGIIAEFLARNPTIQSELRTNPQDLPLAIDEILRINTPLLANRRVTTEQVELRGREIDSSERVTIFWAAANRDPEVFGDPDRFDPVTNATANVLYGRGIHDCPGAPLARLELLVVTQELLAGVENIRPVHGREPDFAVYPAGGFNTLPLIFE
ncbi:MAG: cytochrome P450 [Cryobacterium sp.]|nr:cytochrome P450 [Cryobacterium sp.]